MSEREAVLKEFNLALCDKGDTCTHYDCTGERNMADEIAALRSQLAEVERERENVSSQLWDCTNERDGYKHRAESMERVVEAARKWRELERRYDAMESGALVVTQEEREARFRADIALNELRVAVRALDAEAQP